MAVPAHRRGDRLIRLTVRVTPRGGRDAVEGWVLDETKRLVLKVRVSAAPTDGSANAAVVVLLSKAMKLPKSAVRLAAGETSRMKRFEIDAEPGDLVRAFGNPPGHHKL